MLTDKHNIYNTILRNIPLGFTIVDVKGNIVEFNKKAEEITGFKRSELLNKSHIQIFHNTLDEAACPLLKKSIRKKQKLAAYKSTIKTKEGETITIEITSFPIYNKDKMLEGGVELFRDITKEIKTEVQTKNILSSFAHDIKNPAISAKGFLSRLIGGKAGEISQKQEAYLQIIAESIDRIEQMSTKFLEHSKYESGKVRIKRNEFNAIDIVSNVIKELSEKAQTKNIKISSPRKRNPISIRADKAMINRAVFNLLENAVKHSPANSTIHISSYEKDKRFHFSVTNLGEIPEDAMDNVFVAFYQERVKSKGYGLGLSITKNIIELHKGVIWVESNKGKTTFSFRIPMK